MKNARRVVSALALLAAFGGPAHAVVQRWNIDVIGLEDSVYTFPTQGGTAPSVSTSSLDLHGYFTGEDLNGDGTINLAELREFNPVGLSTDPRASRWDKRDASLTFSYSPTSGLAFTQFISGDVSMTFGKAFVAYSPFRTEAAAWTDATRTTITAVVPEPSSAALLAGGLLLGGLVMRRHRL